MAVHPAFPWLTVEHVGQVSIVRLKIASSLKEATVELISERLFDLAKRIDKPQLLLDFRGVDRLYSILLGKIIALHKNVQAMGGRLVLCNLRPAIYEAFQILRLTQYLHICQQEQEAMQSFEVQ